MAILSKILILGNFLWQIRIPHPKISKIDHLGATAALQSGIFIQKRPKLPQSNRQ